jgi:hypothetical protein
MEIPSSGADDIAEMIYVSAVLPEDLYKRRSLFLLFAVQPQGTESNPQLNNQSQCLLLSLLSQTPSVLPPVVLSVTSFLLASLAAMVHMSLPLDGVSWD